PKFIELCGLVASLEPELEKLKELEAQLSGVAAVIATNKSLEKRLTDIMDDLYPAATKVFGVKTVGAKQEFINVSIRDMN
ncbi:hypothetical protein ACT9SR_13235, partial [Enterococcus faecalis]|uniref:hypothetical protein n=1 Tax=Enterococcus faecalis TaxID=1351 RepID=UPI00403A3B79